MVHAVISEIMERRSVRDQMEKESFVLSGRSFESEALWYVLEVTGCVVSCERKGKGS